MDGTITAEGRSLNPADWTIEGATTFGNPVDESFEYADSEARWTDTTGSDQAIPAEPAFYVPQNASPYWLAIAARALMDSEDMSLPAIPIHGPEKPELPKKSWSRRKPTGPLPFPTQNS